MRKEVFSHTTSYDPSLSLYIKESSSLGFPHLQSMITLYQLFLSEFPKVPFVLVTPHLINERSIGFDVAEGNSLSTMVENDYDSVVLGLITIIDSLPRSKPDLLDQPYSFSTFLGYFKSFFGSDLVFGMLDVTDSNCFVTETGNFTIIDYEWYLDGGVPKNFILYRAAVNLYYRHQDYFKDVGKSLLSVMKDLGVKWRLEPFYFYREKNFQAKILDGGVPNYGLVYGVYTIISRYCGLAYRSFKSMFY